jgi:hypothetical protein
MLHRNVIVGEDRQITIRLPMSIPVGPADIVVVVNPLQKAPPTWEDVRGLGKELWETVDVEKYLNDLRGPWPDEPAR